MIAIFTAGGVSLIIATLATPFLIRYMQRNAFGQHIREGTPIGHKAKAGVPTMGGIAIIFAALAGYLAGHINTGQPFSRAGVLTMVTVTAMAIVGASDDWLKIQHKQNLGLRKRGKFAAQVLIALGFALAGVYWAHLSTNLSFTRYNVPGVDLGTGVWVVWAVLIIAGTSNAVNLTDGLDGLAAGSSAFSFSGMTLIAYWLLRHVSIYRVPTGIDLALAAVSLGGACVGFLWWNAAPARIIMGDTGSLALGTGIACLALDMNLQLLLLIIGGLFVIETLSVVVQVFSFRVFHTRVFRIAPIHHHFEQKGWPEITVTVRFWILSGLFTALGLGLFYADFLSVKGK
jgi:phospho-N-acetylmuramoyl-pentapeptide-transferase